MEPNGNDEETKLDILMDLLFSFALLGTALAALAGWAFVWIFLF